MRRGNLFVISGPSGAGKGTLVAHLIENVPDAWVSISMTTRKPRGHEVDGKEYLFRTVEQFEQAIADGQLLEWAQYATNYYGTPKPLVVEKMQEGRQVILEIEVQGALQVKSQMPEANLIFIEPPSLEELERRLRARATDDEEAIAKRLATAVGELAMKDKYDFRIVNDDEFVAASQLIDFVNGKAEL